MSARGMLQHEPKQTRDQRDGLQTALDEAELECQRLRERLAITDRARQLALADLTAAEMHLDAAGIPSLPQPSDSSDAQWVHRLSLALRCALTTDLARPTFCARIDALVREWPARRERLLSGGGDE